MEVTHQAFEKKKEKSSNRKIVMLLKKYQTQRIFQVRNPRENAWDGKAQVIEQPETRRLCVVPDVLMKF